jgi:peptidoglycan/xylan/chitin deacetylase (PgdA/CDA1 family)
MKSLIERVKRKARTLTPRPVILMYHRVAAPLVDPWDLAVSPANFESQVATLKAERTLMPLADFAHSVERGELPADAVAISFDDGYLDNLQNALPILERHDAPATFFITTGYVGAKVEYWWDELARLLLEPGGDQAAYRQAWARLKAMSDAERQAVMGELRAKHGPGVPDPADLPMTANGIARLAASPQATIGAHSVTHASLAALSAELRAAEIASSREACEAMSGKAVTGFAYPFGDLDEATRSAVQAAGFAFAVSTEQASVQPNVDPLRLPRMSAPNVDGRALLSQIRALP